MSRDQIFRNDTLQTAANSALGVTFDDETTFSLSANTRIVIDELVYQASGAANAASFTVTRGTTAFVASKVAMTGNMKIATPIATMGIRGTTGVVDVPEPGATGAGERSSFIRTPTGMLGGSRCSIDRARGSAFSPKARAHSRSARVPAGA